MVRFEQGIVHLLQIKTKQNEVDDVTYIDNNNIRRERSKETLIFKKSKKKIEIYILTLKRIDSTVRISLMRRQFVPDKRGKFGRKHHKLNSPKNCLRCQGKRRQSTEFEVKERR